MRSWPQSSMLVLHHQNRASNVLGQTASPRTLPITHQPGRPLFLKLPTPDAQRLRRHAHQRAELRGGQFGAKPRIKNREALMARVRAGALALLARIRRTTRPARPAKIRPTKPCSPSPISARSLAPISLFVRHPSPFLPPLGDDRERPYQPLFLDPNRTGTRRGPHHLRWVVTEGWDRASGTT